MPPPPPRDTLESMPLGGPVSDPPVLDVVEGNDQGRTFDLPESAVMIGRGAQCDFVLADLAVSRRHLAIEFDGQGYQLIDQGSGNGTKVNGVRVQTHQLLDGDLIQAGKTRLVFRWPAAGGDLARGGSDTRPTEPFDGLPVSPEPAPRPAPRPRAISAARPGPAARVAPAPRPAPAVRPAPARRPAPAARPAPARRPAPAARPSAQGSGFPSIPPTERVGPLSGAMAPMASVGIETGSVAAGPGGLMGAVGRLTDTTLKKVLVFGGLALILALLTMAMIGKLRGKKTKKKVVHVTAGPTQEQLYEKGKQLVKKQAWDQAEKIFLLLAAKDSKNQFVQTRLKQIRSNREAKSNLARAAVELGKGNYPGAETLALLVGKQTDYFLAAQKIVKKAREKRADALLAEAKALGADKDKKLVPLVMKKIKLALKLSPGYRPALVLWHEFGGPEPPPEVATQQPSSQGGTPKPIQDGGVATQTDSNSGGSDSGHATKRPRGRRSGGNSTSMGGSYKQFMAFYKAKNWSAAAAELRRVAAGQRGARARKTLAKAKKVKQFGLTWKRAEVAQHTNSISAMYAYQRALSLDRSISRGAFGGTLRAKLGKVARAAAGSAFSSGRYSVAYKAVRIARRAGGDSAALKRIVSQLDAKAQGIFNKGYILRDSNLGRAKSYWRQVLRMVPSSSRWHKKASWFLKNYGKAKSSSSDDEL